MSDLVERLRNPIYANPKVPVDARLCMLGAADEIERLTALVQHEQKGLRQRDAEIERLRAALEDAKYLSAEAKNDWYKGRVSVDAYHAALAFDKAAREALRDEPKKKVFHNQSGTP